MDNGYIIYNQIGQLVTDLNTQLVRRPVMRGTIAEQVAWVRSGVVGSEVKFPVRFFANRAKRRGLYEQVGATEPEFVNFSATLHRWAPDGEMIPQGTMLSDVYNILQADQSTMLLQAANEYEYHLACFIAYADQSSAVTTDDGVICGGNTSYDDLPFLSASHLINPNRAAIGTFGNYESALRLDRAGLLTAFQRLDQIKGPDGRVMRMPGKIVVIVNNEDQFDRADVILNGRTRAASVGNGAAEEPNSAFNGKEGGEGGGLLGRAALVKLPDLYNLAPKRWCAVKIPSAEHRPFTVNVQQPPQLYVNGLSPNDFTRITSETVRYGWNGYWGLGYGWPQLFFGADEP